MLGLDALPLEFDLALLQRRLGLLQLDPEAFLKASARAGVLHIDAARIYPHPERYIGLPGQIQRVDDVSFVVRCGDGGCLEVTAWRHPDGWFPRLHDKLGAPIIKWSAA